MDADPAATAEQPEPRSDRPDIQPATPGLTADEDLTADEVAVLELERSWWKYPGAKEAAVRDRFGWTMTRYYQVLNALIDTPAALAYDPLTVNRLRRLRTARQRARQAGPAH